MFKNKKLVNTIAIVSFVFICGVIYLIYDNYNKAEEISILQNQNELIQVVDSGNQVVKEADENTFYVFVCGAIKNSGVYAVGEDTRIFEVIEMAGGLLEDADNTFINQASKVKDGEKIYFPTISEVLEGFQVNADTTDSQLININTASKEQLQGIPGIGEAKANSIIKYRENQGGFKQIEDIMNIEGIKDGVFNKIQDFITVD